MDQENELGFDDYLAIARRRKFLLIVPAMVTPIIVFCASLLIPNRYVSTALVIVEQQKIPATFVQPLMSEDFSERLAGMQEQVLSRTRLLSLADKYRLRRNEPHVDDQAILDEMRKDIVITPVRSSMGASPDSPPGFTISYEGSDRYVAQQVCRDILSFFVAENTRLREQRAQRTTDFLQNQLNDAKRSLDEQDGKLAKFKSAYMGRLPGQEDMNLNVLSGLNTQLQVVTQALHRAQQDKIYAESMLDQQLAFWHSSRGSSSLQTLEAQAQALQTNLSTLQSRYTAAHPDVVRAREELERVQRRLQEKREHESTDASGQQLPTSSPDEPQPIQQLRSQVRQLSVTIADYAAQQKKLEAQIGTYQSRLQLSPAVEQEFKKLTRDYQTALEFYNDLLKKKSQSEMATELEKRQEGERFRVVDAPTLPARPSFPNRLKYTAVGGGLGIALGLALTLFAESRDHSLRDEAAVESALRLRVLACIPVVEISAAATASTKAATIPSEG